MSLNCVFLIEEAFPMVPFSGIDTIYIDRVVFHTYCKMNLIFRELWFFRLIMWKWMPNDNEDICLFKR